MNGRNVVFRTGPNIMFLKQNFSISGGCSVFVQK